ncbi:39S ribosomal protein L51, mitochondrial [Quaeritorhiza haematococci]|nr:39S ribosomal protein L51, mitochondrial [Quaeritorhiza haematococci]
MSGPKRVIELLREAGLHRRLFPEKELTSRVRNGMGAYVPYINKLTFHYDHPRIGGGSKKVQEGMITFIKQHLLPFAEKNQHIEICVQPKPQSQPQIVALYNTGATRTVEVGKMKPSQITKEVQQLANVSGGIVGDGSLLSDASQGKKVVTRSRKYLPFKRRPVMSDTPSVVPLWDPFHADNMFRP